MYQCDGIKGGVLKNPGEDEEGVLQAEEELASCSQMSGPLGGGQRPFGHRDQKEQGCLSCLFILSSVFHSLCSSASHFADSHTLQKHSHMGFCT